MPQLQHNHGSLPLKHMPSDCYPLTALMSASASLLSTSTTSKVYCLHAHEYGKEAESSALHSYEVRALPGQLCSSHHYLLCRVLRMYLHASRH